ncbi:MAG: PLP-dependent aminotransferase family protein [Kiloniellales bacterium]
MAPVLANPSDEEREARPRRRGMAPLISLALDPAAGEPLYRQLYLQLRDAVLAGRLAPGTRLPSSRALAADLGCSRNTVVTAFEQLLSEGYLEGQVGSGSYVSSVLPEELLAAPRPKATAADRASAAPPRGLSARGAALAAIARPRRDAVQPFARRPDVSSFPFDAWGRILGRIWRHPPTGLTGYGDPAGYLPLRRGIVQYLQAVRGLVCEAEQVLITAGGQQALDLTARLLLDPGDAVWIEEPGFPGLRGALTAAGARLTPVPVDGEGLDVAAGLRLAPDARLVAVTPSHQYPLGVTMSLPRRLALLDWARETGAWILEDDYDSEYRFAGRPLAALQGLDAGRSGGAGQVIYVGTFSKVLFPSLRLGYLVVPPGLVASLQRARESLDDHPSLIAQPALAAFIEEGHFATHVRRMRRLYAARQRALVEAAARHLGGLLEIAPDDTGLHLVGRLSEGLAAHMDDQGAARRAAAAGLSVAPLSSFYMKRPAAQGLLLGYAGIPEEQIEPAVKRLAEALRS